MSTTVPLAPDRVTRPVADAELSKLRSNAVMVALQVIGSSVPIAGSMPRVIRVLIHYYADEDHEPQHVYLAEASMLRIHVSAPVRSLPGLGPPSQITAHS